MADNINFDALEEEHDDDDNVIRDLRKALRARNREFRALNDARQTDLAEKRAQLVRAAGLKDAVLEYVPDTVTDKDSFETWLKSDKGSVFADSKAPAQPGEPPIDGAPAVVVPEGLTPEMLAFFQQVQGAEAGANNRQPVGAELASAGLQSLEGKNLSDKELLAAFAALDAGKVPGS